MLKNWSFDDAYSLGDESKTFLLKLLVGPTEGFIANLSRAEGDGFGPRGRLLALEPQLDTGNLLREFGLFFSKYVYLNMKAFVFGSRKNNLSIVGELQYFQIWPLSTFKINYR